MKNLTEGNIAKNFIVFAIPMVLAGILSQMYSTIDTVIAGKFIGEASLAAIGATSPFITFASAIFWGMGSGFAVYIAQLFGAKDYSRIKEELANGYSVMITFLLVFSGLCIVFARPLMTFLSVDEAIKDDAAAYFSIYMAGLTCILLNTHGVYIFNGFGISTYPFIMSIISAVLNITGNIVSVTVLNMGVEGLAASSVLSALVVDVCYIIKLNRCFKEMGVEKHRFQLAPLSFFEKSRYWFPGSLQQAAMYTSGMLLSPLVNSLGSDASASYTVALKVYDINSAIYQNSAKTLSSYAAQCVGGKRLDLLKKGLLVALVQGFMFELPIMLVCALFPNTICSIFFKTDYSGDAITYSVLFLRVFVPMLSFNVIANLFHAFFRGIAEMKPLLYVTALGSLVRLVFGYLLQVVFDLGMYGFYTAWALAWFADAVFGTLFYFKGSWLKRLQLQIGFGNGNPKNNADENK